MTRPGKLQRTPDRAAALARYRQRAAFYDVELAAFEWIRQRAISRLGLRPGDTVLDAGCGTGLSLGLLHQGVGAKGRIVGIDQSPEMIERARERVASHRWRNVTLLNAPAESAEIPVRADAVLFHFTHDVLRRPRAVANVVRHLVPGARIVACGLKWAPAWAVAANLFVWAAARYSVTSLDGLDQPWDGLTEHTGALEVESVLLGAVYIASGRLAGSS